MNEFMKKTLFAVGVIIGIGLFLFITKDDGGGAEVNEGVRMVEEIPRAGNDPESDELSSDIEVMVDVKGEVRNPGVYEIHAGSRVNDVIQKAGGFTDEADETQVNLAQRVHDEMVIIISKIGKEGESAGSSSGTDHEGKIRINVADQPEIETLSGIGPAKAEAIIQYREEHGQFQTVEDLLDISGIGQKTLDNILDEIIIP